MLSNTKTSFILILSLVTLVSGNFIVNLSPTSTLGSATVNHFFAKYPNLFKHVGQVYSFGAFAGFSGNFNLNLIRALQNNPMVHSVVPDVRVTTTEYVDMDMKERFGAMDAEALGGVWLEDMLKPFKKSSIGKKLFGQRVEIEEKNKEQVLVSQASKPLVQYEAPRHLARIQQRKRLSSSGKFYGDLIFFFFGYKLSGLTN